MDDVEPCSGLVILGFTLSKMDVVRGPEGSPFWRFLSVNSSLILYCNRRKNSLKGTVLFLFCL